MAELAIKVSEVSKRYALGVQSASVSDVVRNIFSKKEQPKADFLALSNVSFEVQKGEVLALIGSNGAGKSTLLKTLARITYPTSGTIEIEGRISSLLEVGTGFHPELSGLENIFLNGTILGMRRSEIKSKLEEIIEFSGVSKFINTPVKHYSSGMYVRLAFAVAAHLEPEILIVDEVLAVGDAAFQKKCLGKMNEVAGQGRTVLFVSHNLHAVKTLCTAGIVMSHGVASAKMSTQQAIAHYMQGELGDGGGGIDFPIQSQELIIHGFRIHQSNAVPTEFDGGLPIEIEIEFELLVDANDFRIGIFIKDDMGELVARSLLTDWDGSTGNLQKGIHKLKSFISANVLTAATYTFQIHSSIYGLKDYGIDHLTSTTIKVANPLGFNPLYPGERKFGHLINRNPWTIG